MLRVRRRARRRRASRTRASRPSRPPERRQVARDLPTREASGHLRADAAAREPKHAAPIGRDGAAAIGSISTASRVTDGQPAPPAAVRPTQVVARRRHDRRRRSRSSEPARNTITAAISSSVPIRPIGSLAWVASSTSSRVWPVRARPPGRRGRPRRSRARWPPARARPRSPARPSARERVREHAPERELRGLRDRVGGVRERRALARRGAHVHDPPSAGLGHRRARARASAASAPSRAAPTAPASPRRSARRAAARCSCRRCSPAPTARPPQALEQRARRRRGAVTSSSMSAPLARDAQHARALLREHARGRGADAAGGARDDAEPAFESEIHARG